MENGNGRRIVYGPVFFMTHQYGKLMQLSYDTIAFQRFLQWNGNIADISWQKFSETAVKNERSTL